jgi:AraC-like DNA-binding protein
MSSNWIPPFYLFVAGRQQTSSQGYFNDVAKTPLPRRILVKHTLSGEGVLYVGNKRHVLEADSLFVIERPGPYKYCYEGNGTPWVFEYFSIGLTIKESILPESLSKNPIMSLQGFPDLKAKFDELIRIRLSPDYHAELRHSFLTYAFLMSYISARFEQKRTIPPAVRSLLKALDTNPRSPLNISESCKKLGYTPEALIRLFKKFIGITPGRYFQNRRLTEVCTLLRDSNLSVKEIAQICGFESQNYLGRIFKQTLGVTPGQYRNNPDLLLLESITPKPLNQK